MLLDKVLKVKRIDEEYPSERTLKRKELLGFDLL